MKGADGHEHVQDGVHRCEAGREDWFLAGRSACSHQDDAMPDASPAERASSMLEYFLCIHARVPINRYLVLTTIIFNTNHDTIKYYSTTVQ